VIPLFARAGAIVVRPGATWLAIARERTSAFALYVGYVVPLAAIGPAATYVALHVEGVRVARGIVYRASTFDAGAQAAFAFAYALAGVALVAAMLALLAPLFGTAPGFTRSLRVAAYAFTPAWLAGVLQLVPALAVAQLLALAYALYLLARGVHAVLGIPVRSAVVCAVAAVGCAIAAGFALGVLGASLRRLSP